MPVIPRRRRARPAAMTIVEHLTELRRRLGISILAIVLGAVVGWVFFEPLFSLFKNPYCKTLKALPEIAPPGALSGGECRLFFQGVPDAFLLRLKLAFFAGLILALPIVLYQVWRFVTPGLTKRERRLGLPFVLASLVLFALGAALALWTLPKALGFLLGFARGFGAPIIFADRYVSFVVLVILAFGLSFEFPILLIFLAGARVITAQQMRRRWREAYLGITVAAAVLTPSQDPWTMLGMAVPLVVFYELSILIARLFKR